jgi:hypothetical protein
MVAEVFKKIKFFRKNLIFEQIFVYTISCSFESLYMRSIFLIIFFGFLTLTQSGFTSGVKEAGHPVLCDRADSDALVFELAQDPTLSLVFDSFVDFLVRREQGASKKERLRAAVGLTAHIKLAQKYIDHPVLEAVHMWLQAHGYILSPTQRKRKRLKKLVIAGTVIGAVIATGLAWNAIRKNRIQRNVNEVVMSESRDLSAVALRYNIEFARAVAQDYNDFGYGQHNEMPWQRGDTVQNVHDALILRRISLCSKMLEELNRRRTRGKLRGEHARGRRLLHYNRDRPVFGVDLHTSGGDMFGDRANHVEEAYARRTGSGMPLLTLKQLGAIARAQSGRSQRNPVMEVVLASQLDTSSPERSPLPPNVVSIIHEYLVGKPSQRERMLSKYFIRPLPEFGPEAGGAGQGVVHDRVWQAHQGVPRGHNLPEPMHYDDSDNEAFS